MIDWRMAQQLLGEELFKLAYERARPVNLEYESREHETERILTAAIGIVWERQEPKFCQACGLIADHKEPCP